MGWNIEIATVRTAAGTDLAEIVPDVFESTNAHVGWEDATSVRRGTDLCAGWLKDWAVVVDINCRLSTSQPFLKAASSIGELFVFRVANQPIVVHYQQGKLVGKHQGLQPVLLALGKKMPKKDEVDGEAISIEWIRTQTGLDFAKDFWKAQYTVFKLD